MFGINKGTRNDRGYVTTNIVGTSISITEHRAIMMQLLGRDLEDHENVHHINGVRDDNRPENLELWSKSQPSGQRVVDKIEWATDLLAFYAPERLSKAQWSMPLKVAA